MKSLDSSRRRKLVSLTLPILVVGIASALFALKTRTPKEGVAPGGNCGPKALLAVCESYGIRATEEELALLAGTDDEGTTMYGLGQAAKRKGLHPVGLQVDFETLKDLPMPLIAFMKDNHFVVVDWVGEETARLTDLGDARLVERARFEKDWKGYVLAFNTSESSNRSQ